MKNVKATFSVKYEVKLPFTDVTLVEKVARNRGLTLNAINLFYSHPKADPEKCILKVCYLQLTEQGLYVHDCASGADFTYMGTYHACEYLSRVAVNVLDHGKGEIRLNPLSGNPIQPSPTGATACK